MESNADNPTASEEQRASLPLLLNQQLLPLIVNNMPQAVFWKDTDLVYLGCNQAFAQDVGLSSPEEIIGKTDYDLPSTDQAELYRADDRQIIETGQARLNYEEPHTSPDGSPAWLRTSKIPLRDADGKIVAIVGMYEDITERKLAELSYQDAAERQNLILDTVPTAMLITRLPDGKILFANREIAHILGIEDESDVVGRPVPDFYYDPADRATVLGKVQEDGYLENFELRAKRADGSMIWVLISIRPIEYMGEKALMVVLADITERKRMEVLQKESDIFMRLVMENIPQALFWKDANLVYLGCNEAFAEDAGLATPEEVVGKTDFDMPWVEQAELYRQDDQKVLDSGVPKLNYEEPQTTPDGKTIWLRTSKVPMYDADGKAVAVLGMYEDITERKQIEVALQEAETRYSAVVSQAMDGIVLIEEQKITFANQALADMMMYDSPEEIVNQPFAKFLPPDQQQLVAQRIRARMAGEEVPNVYESRLVRNDGTIIDCEFSGGIIEVMGKPVDVGIIRDITERKKAERLAEEMFARRGQQVQVSTQIAQELSTATEQQELFNRVVTLTKEQLGYYHTQLLRFDPTQDAVVLITGYGETGQKMLEMGHRMPMGSGLIGTAAATGETVMRPDLAAGDPDWKPNPLLPETKGEIAVPIKLGEQILGVLDVQSDRAGALGEDDRLLLEGLCGQIAISMEQTRLRQEMQERLEEINALYRAMSREGWESYRSTSELPSGFLFDRQSVTPLSAVTATTAAPQETIPLSVRGGETIGALGIFDDPNHPLSEEEREFLEQVSEQVALALESARLFEQTQNALVEVQMASQALQKSQAQLAEAMDVANMASWELDMRSLVFTFNDKLYEMLGTTAERENGYDMPADKFAEFVHPEDAPLIYGAIQQALEDPANHSTGAVEFRSIGRDGTNRYILSEYRVEMDSEGHPLRGYGSHLDITQRKKAEEALAKRATEMAAVANISTDVSSLREPDQILETVVNQTKENFSLYHAHIYLLNEAGDELNLAAGAGEIGQKMVSQGWRIPIDHQQSLVARAARTHQGVIVNDVRSEPDFMPNELLPDTRSELAVPLIVGNKVLGVLDVQSNELDHFSQEDVYIQTTLASQVAIALENARTFIQTQRQAEFEAMINAISQKIQSTTSIDNALQVAVRELGRALGSKRAAVHLSVGENDKAKAGVRSDGN